MASALFRDPKGPVLQACERIDELQMRLSETVRQSIASLRAKIAVLFQQLMTIEPHRLLGTKAIKLNNLQNGLQNVTEGIAHKYALQLTAGENRLEALDPRSVLSRGYSITTNKKTNKVIISADDVRRGEVLITELSKGNLVESKVKKVHNVTENK